MKSLTATLVVLATALASPAFAASVKHRSLAVQAGSSAFGQATNGQLSNGQLNNGPFINSQAGNGNAVIYGNRVIGQDPDPNIRTQMLRDPVPSDY